MSKLKCLPLVFALVFTAYGQKLDGHKGSPVAQNFIISAEILDEGSFQLQRSTNLPSNWAVLTAFNSLPGTNSFSDTRTNKQAFYRLVRLNIPPALTTQPSGSTNFVGQEVRLEAAATGSWPLRYQWLKNGQPLAGATSNKLVLTGRADFSGSYVLSVSNNWGTVSSSPAVVSAINPAVNNIAGLKIRYLIKVAEGNYVNAGTFESTYNAQGFYSTTSANSFLNDTGSWQYGRLSEPGVGRALLGSQFVYPNGVVLDMTFTNQTGGTYLLQEFDNPGGQIGEFAIIQ